MTAGKKAGTTRATKRNTRLTLELLETARDMHASGLLTDVVREDHDASSGLVALVWFDDAKDPPKLREVFVFGVSLPLIVKQFLKSRPENITLGAKSASYFDVR
ncbi:hypothetical protein AB8B21_29195 [Tardiphaga sp. 866_E4_N2_1]|uniref:hypothetical protein n=1 Tax=unclassified Tardiphaga TaxID=2631404 RepID=UPI003F271D1C